MPSFKELKNKLNKTFKTISASPVEITYMDPVGDYVIVRYEERDPITGGCTKDYLYTICTLEGNMTDDVSYDSEELCKSVLNQKVMGDEFRIGKLVAAYNREIRKRLDEEKNKCNLQSTQKRGLLKPQD